MEMRAAQTKCTPNSKEYWQFLGVCLYRIRPNSLFLKLVFLCVSPPGPGCRHSEDRRGGDPCLPAARDFACCGACRPWPGADMWKKNNFLYSKLNRQKHPYPIQYFTWLIGFPTIRFCEHKEIQQIKSYMNNKQTRMSFWLCFFTPTCLFKIPLNSPENRHLQISPDGKVNAWRLGQTRDSSLLAAPHGFWWVVQTPCSERWHHWPKP